MNEPYKVISTAKCETAQDLMDILYKMTDGITGFHVAPITEADMNLVQSVLKRAADAIVGVSQLTADVDMLRQTVSGLQADTERLRSQNNALDEASSYSRKQRDDLNARLTEVDHMLITANNEAARYMEERNNSHMQAEQLQIDLDLTRKERDEAQFSVLELTDKLATSEAKLAKIEANFKDIFGTYVTPQPEVFTPKAEAHPLQTDDPNLPSVEPAPITDTRPETLDEWQSGYFWDRDTSKYWRNGITPRL